MTETVSGPRDPNVEDDDVAMAPGGFLGVTESALDAAVVVREETDLFTAPNLGDTTDDATDDDAITARLRGDRSIVLDLTAVTFVDASELRVLVSAMRRLTSSGAPSWRLARWTGCRSRRGLAWANWIAASVMWPRPRVSAARP
jgi:hypothetical protein